VPIALHDPVAGVLACVHAGWRGTVAGVSAAALTAMQALGSRPSDVIAGIGPAFAASRYQVGPDVHQAVTQAFGPAAASFIRPDARPDSHPDAAPQSPDTPQAPYIPQALDTPQAPDTPDALDRWLLDLWAANRHALVEAGVPAPQIHTTTLPTGPTPATPTGPTTPTSPAIPATPTSPASPTSPATPTGPGYFFSDRTARPCGRLALIARLRAPGRNGMDVTT
jgi:hypothetical protein